MEVIVPISLTDFRDVKSFSLADNDVHFGQICCLQF